MQQTISKLKIIVMLLPLLLAYSCAGDQQQGDEYDQQGNEEYDQQGNEEYDQQGGNQEGGDQEGVWLRSLAHHTGDED